MQTAEEKLAEKKLKEEAANIDEHPRVTLNSDGTRTLVLNRPIPIGKNGNEIAELVFKNEITAGDLEVSDECEGKMGQANRLIAAMTGVSYPNIRLLRADDLQVAGLVIGRLSGNEDETGGTS